MIGAQAVYLDTGSAAIAIAEATKDSDLAVDVRTLRQEPHIDAAMERGGFILNPASHQPGAWISPNGIPVDLMVPEAIAGGHSRRSSTKLAGAVTAQAMTYLQELFANGPNALGSAMAGRTEEGVGDPETVAQACAVLATDLVEAVDLLRTTRGTEE